MAGGNKDFLFKGVKGANYGNSMWQYLKNSVDAAQPKETHQMVRKVSFNKDFFFDVQLDRTLKHIFMGKIPQWTPRLWEPVWPRNGELLMDSAYYSVQPCRPNGIASDCCLFNIEDDWQENNPMPTDCSALSLTGKQLFVIEDGCPTNSEGKQLNQLCIEPGGIADGAVPSKFSLWSHYGAGGPFTNSIGVPIDDFPMKCACLSIDSTVTAANFFTLPVFSPTECIERDDYNRIAQGVKCDGNFTFDSPVRNTLQGFADQAIDIVAYQKLITKEIKQRIALDLPGLIETLRTYNNREGFTEWANSGKFPFIIEGLDTCREKGVSPVPWPVDAMTPYLLGIRDPTIPRLSNYKVGLCAVNSLNVYFCPSHDNPLLEPVQTWNFGNSVFNDGSGVVSNYSGQKGTAGLFDRKPYGIFADGRIFQSMSLAQCALNCRIRAKGTAYIGDGPHGLAV